MVHTGGHFVNTASVSVQEFTADGGILHTCNSTRYAKFLSLTWRVNDHRVYQMFQTPVKKPWAHGGASVAVHVSENVRADGQSNTD